MERILVIKHGGFGDFILATASFAAIRKHHAGAHITLLTTRPYMELAKASPYFDDVWRDDRPKWWQLGKWLRLRRRLRAGRFVRVYDLQTSGRSALYFRLFSPEPEWSGQAPGASHRHDNPERGMLHTIELEREQLAIAGIREFFMPDVSWLKADTARFGLPARFSLIVPGCSPHRPEKRWSAEGFAALADNLAAQGVTPVFIGTKDEAAFMAEIKRCASAPFVDLLGQTDFADIATLARGAVLAVGNDTGPMHLIAAAGCHSLVLFSHASDPARCAPRGGNVRVVQVAELKALPVARVMDALQGWV